MKLLTKGNSKVSCHVFSLPAIVTCPCAGYCARWCYARQGTYRFPIVKKKRQINYEISQDTMQFMAMMHDEIGGKKRTIRIHDSGDFYSYDYLQAWLMVAANNPQAVFYCYTKMVSLFKMAKEACYFPDNLHYVFSFGGKEDHLITGDDRSCRMFADKLDMPDEYCDLGEGDGPIYETDRKLFGVAYHGKAKLETLMKRT